MKYWWKNASDEDKQSWYLKQKAAYKNTKKGSTRQWDDADIFSEVTKGSSKHKAENVEWESFEMWSDSWVSWSLDLFVRSVYVARLSLNQFLSASSVLEMLPGA